MENRRAHPRYETSLSMEVYTGNDIVLAIAKNLSVGGVGIAMREPLPEQAPVGLSMFLVEDGIEDETSTPLNLTGHVMWCSPSETGGHQAGIRFDPLTPPQRQTIDTFLKRLTGQA